MLDSALHLGGKSCLTRAVQSLGTPFFWYRCFWPTPTTVENVHRTEEVAQDSADKRAYDGEIWQVVETL